MSQAIELLIVALVLFGLSNNVRNIEFLHKSLYSLKRKLLHFFKYDRHVDSNA